MDLVVAGRPPDLRGLASMATRFNELVIVAGPDIAGSASAAGGLASHTRPPRAPGPGTRAPTHPVEIDFQYSDVFGRPSPEAYERLLLDVMAGDASRFMRRDAVEASWAWVTKILEGWQRQGLRWLPEYQSGSCGPVDADRII